MNITHLGHSCLLIESDDSRVLVDPGAFSDDWHHLDGLDAIFFTHAHPDHYDPNHVPELLRRNTDAQVFAETGLASDLARDTTDVVISPNQTYTAGALQVRACGGAHAVIHNDIPRIGNVGLVFTDSGGATLYHPGDAIDTPAPNVDMLALPIMAPWCAMKETVEFLRTCAPRAFMPIHDGLLASVGRNLFCTQLDNLSGDDVRLVDAAQAEKAVPVSRS